VFYFFRRGEQFVRCELRKVDDGYQLIILRVDGTEAVEQYDSEDKLTARWSSLQQELLREGWWGPHGRE
jgi:hypothetical protein